MLSGSNINPVESLEIPEVDGRYNRTVQEYVEVIRDLTAKSAVARVKDIAEQRGVTRASVSSAVGSLVELGLVRHEHYGYVTLTEPGRELGDAMTLRHRVIRQFLENLLQLEPEIADREACILEHTMSPETLNALVRFIRKVDGCPRCCSTK